MASHRRTGAAALAVILASVSLYPVFIGVLWFWAGCGSVLVVALAGTVTRLRRLPVPVVLALGAAALLLYLNLAFANAKSLYHLLPTPGSLATLFDLAGQGFNEASKYAPPVPELRGMVLLAAAGVGIAALLTDLIAVRLGSAALAGLPLLLLFTEPFTLSVSRGFLGTTVAFCACVAGYLALLSSEGRDRIREWEHPNPAVNDEPDTRTLAAAGRRVGFASVVIALCLPLFIPGLHATRLFGGGQPGIGGSGGGPGSAGAVGFPDPNVQLSQELRSGQPVPVLTYKTTDPLPSYLQIYAVDKLTDAGWQLANQAESPVSGGSQLPQEPGLTTTGPGLTRETTTITLGDSVGQDPLAALPVPYPPTSVTAGGSLRTDKSTLMVFDSGVSFGGLKYSVTSLDEAPPTQLLNSAPPPAESVASRDLSVPRSYAPLLAVATSIVRAAGAKTPLAEAIALQNYLTNGSFKYTLTAPTVLSAPELTKFLTVAKAGYCQQFSFAMAVLARLLGIPSRVAYGFTSGAEVAAGTWQVTTHDAHAWPELYFQGYGWLRFEPTPGGADGQGTATSPSYSLTPVNPAGTSPTRATPSAGTSTVPGGAQGLKGITPPFAGEGQSGAFGQDSAALSPWAIFGLVVAGLLVLAVPAPWCARRLIRYRRWRRGQRRGAGAAGGPVRVDRADRVRARDVAWAHAAWQELRDDLEDYGAAALPSESPRTVAARAGTGLELTGPARAALGRIAMAEERARYAAAPADGSGLRADSAAVRRAIAASAPRGARWRGRLLPASVVGPALGALASASDLYPGSRGGRLFRRSRAEGARRPD